MGRVTGQGKHRVGVGIGTQIPFLLLVPKSYDFSPFSDAFSGAVSVRKQGNEEDIPGMVATSLCGVVQH